LSAIFDLLKTIPGKLGLPPCSTCAGGLVGRPAGSLLFFGPHVLCSLSGTPSRKPPSRAAFFSALLIGGLWELAKYLFRLYIDYINYFTAVYGLSACWCLYPLGVLFLLLFVLGGELMWLMMRTRK